jgi:hypothetical protein
MRAFGVEAEEKRVVEGHARSSHRFALRSKARENPAPVASR